MCAGGLAGWGLCLARKAILPTSELSWHAQRRCSNDFAVRCVIGLVPLVTLQCWKRHCLATEWLCSCFTHPWDLGRGRRVERDSPFGMKSGWNMRVGWCQHRILLGHTTYKMDAGREMNFYCKVISKCLFREHSVVRARLKNWRELHTHLVAYIYISFLLLARRPWRSLGCRGAPVVLSLQGHGQSLGNVSYPSASREIAVEKKRGILKTDCFFFPTDNFSGIPLRLLCRDLCPFSSLCDLATAKRVSSCWKSHPNALPFFFTTSLSVISYETWPMGQWWNQGTRCCFSKGDASLGTATGQQWDETPNMPWPRSTAKGRLSFLQHDT